jgi:hypothetical protein
VALTGGEASDFKGYMPVMDADGPAPKALLADKGYDADLIRQDMERRRPHSHDPDQAQPTDSTACRCRNLSPAQHGRTLLQQAQKRPEAGNLLQQKRRQLPRLHSHRLNPPVDPPICQYILDARDV